MRLILGVIAAVMAVVPGACTFHQGMDNPIERKLSWFSYLDGDDIRAACAPGAPDRYRFVYNGVYVEQLRMYEVRTGENGGPRLEVQVRGKPNVAEIGVASPADLLKPWRGTTAEVPLAAGELERLRRAMADSGVFSPPPSGLELFSDDFYWVVVGCRDGEVFFDAYLWPSPRFDAASFPEVLANLDPTGIPFNPPRRTTTVGVHGGQPPTIHPLQFNLKVGERGLAGLPF